MYGASRITPEIRTSPAFVTLGENIFRQEYQLIVCRDAHLVTFLISCWQCSSPCVLVIEAITRFLTQRMEIFFVSSAFGCRSERSTNVPINPTAVVGKPGKIIADIF